MCYFSLVWDLVTMLRPNKTWELCSIFRQYFIYLLYSLQCIVFVSLRMSLCKSAARWGYNNSVLSSWPLIYCSFFVSVNLWYVETQQNLRASACMRNKPHQPFGPCLLLLLFYCIAYCILWTLCDSYPSLIHLFPPINMSYHLQAVAKLPYCLN